jgi:hypothetical protein
MRRASSSGLENQAPPNGVLAPNAKLRKFVVPQPPEDDERGCGRSVAWEETRQGKTIRRRWIPWAELLLKVFAVDVFDCPDCHSRMQRIAWITHPKVIRAITTHRTLP